MYSFYLILTQDFCEAHIDYQIGASVFGYAVTTNGRYVCSTNALNEFPNIFTGDEEISKIYLSEFPAPPDVVA